MNDKIFQDKLQRAEFTRLRYRLRLRDQFLLPGYALLRLRREFKRILKTGLVEGSDIDAFRHLLRPQVPVDPGLRRRVQQPAPGFVIQVSQLKEQPFEPGELLALTVCFFGDGLLQIELFSQLLKALGDIGLTESAGRFDIVAIENACRSDEVETLWNAGPFEITPQIVDLTELLGPVPPTTVRLELLTPARLIRNGRPLFHPEFTEIFPFILRRTTSMLAAWAELEEIVDVGLLLEDAARIKVVENRLRWQDWRPLQGEHEAGGLCGQLELAGDGLPDLWPILKLGELFGIGKGAAFGAGRYCLD